MRLLFCFTLILGLLFLGGSEAQAQVHPKNNSPIKVSETYDSTACQALRDARRAAGGGGGVIENMMEGGGAICPCAPAPGLWLDRIVSCFAGKPDGLIYNSVGSIITYGPYRDFYVSIVFGSILLAIVLFGINLTLGSVQSIPKDSFTLILKIAGVTLFFTQYFWVYGLSLDAIQGLASNITQAADNIGNICETTYNGESPTLWARWDCLFQKFTGFVGGNIALGIAGFMVSLLFSGGMAIGVFIGLLYVILTLVLIGMRLVYTYLVAIMAVSFLFLLAPLFVPMILFGLTYKQFTTWFKMIIAYMLQPMLLMLFMILMLTALEFTIFKGPTSLYAMLANDKSATEATSFMEALSLRPTGKVATIAGGFKAVTGSTVDDWSNYIRRTNILEFFRHVSPEVETLARNASDKLDDKLSDVGLLGKKRELTKATKESVAKGLEELGSHKGGIRVYTIDWEGFMGFLNGRTDKVIENIDTDQWMQNVILQLLATAILVFILYNMVNAVPQITHDLVSQQFGSSFKSATKARMVGEGEMRKSLEGLREAGRRAAQTGGDLGSAAREVANEAVDSMVGGRR